MEPAGWPVASCNEVAAGSLTQVSTQIGKQRCLWDISQGTVEQILQVGQLTRLGLLTKAVERESLRRAPIAEQEGYAGPARQYTVLRTRGHGKISPCEA